MQLSPNETFSIVRQLDRQDDSGTYYVRAVIRDTTDTTIDTVNLTLKGNHRYAADWQVAKDTTGNGRYITITTIVYTDSGYTTISPAYSTELSTYLIHERMNPRLGYGGGGDVSYEKIRKLIQEELEKKIIPVSFEALNDKLRGLEEKMNDFPSVDMIDIAIRNVNDNVKAIKIPEVDLTLVNKKINENGEKIKIVAEELRNEINSVAFEIKKIPFAEIDKNVQKKIDLMEDKLTKLENSFNKSLEEIKTTLKEIPMFKFTLPKEEKVAKLKFAELLGI